MQPCANAEERTVSVPNLRVTNLWDTKFVRLLRSQAAALNDNRNPGRRSLREEALPCCVPCITGEHIVARVILISTRLLLTESKHYEKLLSIVSNCELRLPYHVTNISEK